MIDPRDEEEIRSDDNLTNDEDEELINLQKQYELKVQSVLEKRKKDEKAQQKFVSGITTAPVKRSINFENRIFTFDLGTPVDLDCDEEETFTRSKLRKRYYTDEAVQNYVQQHNIKLLTVYKVLAKIVKPQFKEPEYDNWAFIGVIVEKSMLKTQQGDKYIKFRVGNFEHNISINLFGDAMKNCWTKIVGELVIILNPSIHHTGKNFEFYSGDDIRNIISIGIIKDIKKCEEPKCTKYVPGKYQYCEYHELKQEQKFLKNKRMELNGSVKLFNPKHKLSQNTQKTYNEDSSLFHLKSQFDGSKYDQDTMFQNKGSKRKLQDAKANENLENKLMKISSIRYNKIGLVKQSTEMHNPISKSKTELINEMKLLTKDKPINLGMSRDDKLNKLKRWNDNLTKAKKPLIIKATTIKKPSNPTETSKSSDKSIDRSKIMASLTNRPQPKAKLFEDFEIESSDDELEISFTGKQLDEYNKLKQD